MRKHGTLVRAMLLLLMCTLGLTAGGLLQPNSALAEAPCTEDECEGGSECLPNNGNNTFCDMLAKEVCETGSC